MGDIAAAIRAIRAHRFAYHDEDMLQESLALLLANAGHAVQREVRLRHGRIDLLVDGCTGVEVKVAGSTRAAVGQLRRYARDDRIDRLVLVTTRASHRVPEFIDGKPVTLISLAGARL